MVLKVDDLPKDRRGNSWFWPLMKEGESGVNLAKRLPQPSDWVTVDHVFVWTKVSNGRPAWYLVMLKTIEGWAAVSMYG